MFRHLTLILFIQQVQGIVVKGRSSHKRNFSPFLQPFEFSRFFFFFEDKCRHFSIQKYGLKRRTQHCEGRGLRFKIKSCNCLLRNYNNLNYRQLFRCY